MLTLAANGRVTKQEKQKGKQQKHKEEHKGKQEKQKEKHQQQTGRQ